MSLFGSKPLESTLEEEMRTIRSSLGRIAEQVAGAAGDGLRRPAADVERNLAGLGALVEDFMGRGRRETRKAYDEASAYAESGAGELAAQVTRHPVAALGLAALIGFTIGIAAGGGKR
jgi:ElaB/YqjD/DUF883 family membrane-anchored ribosome-binding protein